jgi:hypothetical protein
MRKFNRTEGTESRLEYSLHVETRLLEDEATRSLAPPLQAAGKALALAARETLAREQAARLASAAVDSEERLLEHALRAVAKLTVVEAGGAPHSALCRELFPDGFSRMIKVRGARQLEVAVRVAARLAASRCEEADEVRHAWTERLAQRVAALRAALEARDGARAAVGEARRVEEQARDEHGRELMLVDAKLRALFPYDRVKLASFFPRARRVRVATPTTPQTPPGLDAA